ncbi:MAG TPA: CocE/NonD family hydrolase [Oscillospiraceae bacterium]|nr:CocE/NonD family hydrolase [Oscillospiraceae bacterium]
MGKKMEIIRVLLKIAMWLLIIGFGCNFIMQTISYAFYKNAEKMAEVSCEPQFIQMSDTLTGYGYNLDKQSDQVILFFGGSNYIAYNSVGKYAGEFDCPFISADYYGTQDSKGKMNLSSIQRTAEDMYDWAKKQYPTSKIIIMGHSYAAGTAVYLASVRKCDKLILAAAYRDVSDLYNKIIPIFWGPLKIFISNNIEASKYAKNVDCPVYIIGSNGDKTLSAALQEKVSKDYADSKVKIFDNISHEDYYVTPEVIEYIKGVLE